MEQANNPQDVSVTMQLIFFLTIMSLAPSIFILMTSFTRIVIVFSLLRTAMGTGTVPPSQVLVGLALILTFFIMSPVLKESYEKAYVPYTQGQMTFGEMIDEGKQPFRKFMLKNTRKKDLRTFIEISNQPRPKSADEISDTVLLASFVTSELTTAFQMGFIVYLPFLVIDFVVASVLLAMGMMMLPPAMVSVPFKIMLFVLVDGWGLIVTSLVKSFG